MITEPPLDQDQDPEPEQEPVNNRPIPPKAEKLQDLIEHLYPEPTVVEIITLDKFKEQYGNDIGLGAAAVASMERAQRITRKMSDPIQIGLADFHIGLIYLHWGQILGAIKYFENAQQHWGLNYPAVSLALFAQGVCHHQAFHFESALINYGQVQQTLNRIGLNRSGVPASYLTALRECLNDCHQDIVRRIQNFRKEEGSIPKQEHEMPPINGEDGQAAAEEPAEPAANDDTEPASAEDASEAADVDYRTPSPPIPINNMIRNRAMLENEDALVSDPDNVSDGESRETAVLRGFYEGVPIPQHMNQSDYLIWYKIANRADLEDFLPKIQADTTLLVDTRTEIYTCDEGDLVIVNEQDTEGSIVLEPQQGTEDNEQRSPRRIILGEVEQRFSFDKDSDSGEIYFYPEKETETGKIKIAADQPEPPIRAKDVIGVVIGIWSKLRPARK